MIIGRYPKYEIFEDGRIVRFNKVLKQRLNRFGYPVVFLYNNRKRRQEFVHRLLLESFVPKPDPSYNQVNHINGVKSDNRLSNLEWSNNSKNQLHAYSTGLRSKSRGWKIDKTQSKVILQCFNDGLSIRSLSKYFKVTPECIKYHITGSAKRFSYQDKITNHVLTVK